MENIQECNISKGVYLGKKAGIINNKNIFLNEAERLNQTYIIGKQYSGKYKMALNLMIQDIQNGNGCCVIDENGEYTEELLKYIPKEKAKDVVYFDASNEGRPMGLNLYEIDSLDEANIVVEYATEMFLNMFGPEIFGPRIQEYFEFGSLTLLEDFEDRPTLLDVVRLFTDDGFREFKTAKVTNIIVRSWRERTYNAMGDREKAEIIPYFSSKFVSLTTNRLVRNIIGQQKSAFDFNGIINNRKILLVNLAKDKIGDISGDILSMLLIYKIKLALDKRSYLSKENLTSFFLYINNFQNNLSTSYGKYLKKAKENKIGITLIHDYVNQLAGMDKKDLKNKEKCIQDIINNTGNICIFNSFGSDAELFEKELLISKGTIKNLKENQFIYVNQSNNKSIKINGYRECFATPIEKVVPLLKEYCKKKYGRSRDFVEAEFCYKYGIYDELQEIKEPDDEIQTKVVKKSKTIKQNKKTKKSSIKKGA